MGYSASVVSAGAAVLPLRETLNPEKNVPKAVVRDRKL